MHSIACFSLSCFFFCLNFIISFSVSNNLLSKIFFFSLLYALHFFLLSILILFSSFLTSFGFPLLFPSLFFLGTPFIQSMFSMLRSITIISIALPSSHIFFHSISFIPFLSYPSLFYFLLHGN